MRPYGLPIYLSFRQDYELRKTGKLPMHLLTDDQKLIMELNGRTGDEFLITPEVREAAERFDVKKALKEAIVARRKAGLET